MPVAVYSLASELPLPALRRFADDVIRPAIERIDGVARVDIQGGTEREIHVDVDRVKLDALGIVPQTILHALAQGGLTVPAGRLTRGAEEVNVRTVGELASVDALRALIIANARDGSAVRLSDVAQIEDGFAEARARTFLNGAEAVSFEVVKQSGRNTVAVVDAVQRELAAIGPTFPNDVRATLILECIME